MIRNLLFILLFSVASVQAQTVVSVTKLQSYSILDLLTQGIITAGNPVDLYHVIYNTVDPQGNPTIASGAMTIPIIADCDSFPLVSYNHGTVLAKDDVPSRQSGEEFVGLSSSGSGSIGILPDYLGLGDSPGLHPYQHAESEATATLDMIRACRSYVTDSLGLNFNGQVFLTGYSQGGHAAMATHKYIEDNNLTSEFNVVVSAPASGAYDMSETTADFIFQASYSNPGYIVYLIEAYQTVYGDLYQNKEDYYKSPYDTLILPYLTGDSVMASLNAILPNQIDSFIQDSVLANYQADTINYTHPLRRALRDNDVYDWTPQAQIEMSYCEADEQVPFQNSTKTAATMQANGATNVAAFSRGSTLNHGGCVIPSLTSIQGLFINLAKTCVTTGITAQNLNLNFNYYPNPATDQVTFEWRGNDSEQITLLSIVGKKLQSQELFPGKNYLELNNYPKGVYLIYFEGYQAVRKLIIQ